MLDRSARKRGPTTDAEKVLAEMEHAAVGRWIWQENEKKKRARKLNKQDKEYLQEQAAEELAAARKALYTLEEELEEEYDYDGAYVKEEPDTEMVAEVEPSVVGPFNFVEPGEFHDFKQEPHEVQQDPSAEQACEDFVTQDAANDFYALFKEALMPPSDDHDVPGKDNAGDAVPLPVRLRAFEDVVEGEAQVKDDEDAGAVRELVGSSLRGSDSSANETNWRSSSLPPVRKRFGRVIIDDAAEENQEPQEEQENPAECLPQANGDSRSMQTEPGSSTLEEASLDTNSNEMSGSTKAAFRKRPAGANLKKTLDRRPNCDQSSSARLSPHAFRRPRKHAVAEQPYGQTHTDEQPYWCIAGGCAESFARRDHLQDQLQTHTDRKRKADENGEAQMPKDKTKKRSPCPVCSKELASQHMKRHMRSHTDERPYPCTFCAKSFRRAQHRRNHMLRVHTGEKPFKCNTCPACFVRPCELMKHSKIHVGGGQIFACKKCGQAFSQNNACMQHFKKCQAN